MIDDLYNARILELAGHIDRIGRLDQPDGTASAHSKLCGSTVTVDLKLADGIVTDFAHEVRACALGQASSSLLAANIVGHDAAELGAIRDSLTAWLAREGDLPAWPGLDIFVPALDYTARHPSIRLAFEAAADAAAAAATQRGDGTDADQRSATASAGADV